MSADHEAQHHGASTRPTLAVRDVARVQEARHEEPATATAHHAAHPATHLHLDRAGRLRIGREVRDGPGRPRRLEDDPRRLRADAAAGQARQRREARPAHSRAREQAGEPAEDLARINRDRFRTGNRTKEAKKGSREHPGRLGAKPKTRRFAGHSPMGETWLCANHVLLAGPSLRLA